MVAKGAAAAGVLERAEDVGENDEVDRRDQQQEGCRDRGSEQRADALQRGELRLHDACGDGDGDRKGDDDGRVPEREEKSNAYRLPALLHELARDVVYCGYVIGVHRVAQSERIRKQRRPEQNRV